MRIPRALAPWTRQPSVRRDRKRKQCALRLEGLESRELLSVLTVTNNSDSAPGSLRDRIAAAQPGDVIQFSPLLQGDTITLTSGEIDVSNNITIQGPGPNLLAISGNHSSQIFEVPSSSLSISG
jgi:hypothetical protein